MWRDCRIQEVPCFPVKIRSPGEHVWLSGSDKGGKSKSSFHWEQPFPGRRVGKSEWWSKVEPWIDTARVCRNEISQLLSYLTQIFRQKEEYIQRCLCPEEGEAVAQKPDPGPGFLHLSLAPPHGGSHGPGQRLPTRLTASAPETKAPLFSPKIYWGMIDRTLDKLKLYNMMIWHTYIFWNDYKRVS